MPQVERVPADAIPRPSSESVSWVRKNPVILAAVGLICAELCWKAYLLSHFYFRQDDFQLMDHALASRFSLRYLLYLGPEQLSPGGRAVTWLLVRISLYNWTLTSGVTIVLLAAAGVALLRLLVILFGRRPAILIPLTIYLFTPLMLPGLSFWTTTTLWLPLQLAIPMAIGAHVRYVRSGRIGHAFATGAWLGVGMLFDELGVFVPVLIFALTSAYLVPGSWLQSAGQSLLRYSRAWGIYLALTAGYLLLFLLELPTSVQQPTMPRYFSSVLTLVSAMLRVSYIPAAFGGLWHWFAPGGDYGYAAETPGLTQVTWVLAALVVAASLWYRRGAVRAWVILVGWIVVADLGPVAVSRLGEIRATVLGADLHYVADSAPLLAVTIGLAFWPVLGERDPYRVARPRCARPQVAALILGGSIVVSSLWSAATYLNSTSSRTTHSYIANARVALAKAAPGTVIMSGPTPPQVMFAGYLGAAAQTSRVLGPLAPKSAKIRFTNAPEGAITSLMIIDGKGRLRPALDVGATSARAPGKGGCWPVMRAPTRIPLSVSVFTYNWIIRLRYSGPATTMRIRLGRAVRDVALPPGRGNFYVPVTGGGSAVVLRQLSPGPAACISSLTVGQEYATTPTVIPRGGATGKTLARAQLPVARRSQALGEQERAGHGVEFAVLAGKAIPCSSGRGCPI